MQLMSSLSEKLKKFVSDPTVTVTVTTINSRKVYILGEVTRPGAFPLVTGYDCPASAYDGRRTDALRENLEDLHPAKSERSAEQVGVQLQASGKRWQSGTKHFIEVWGHGRLFRQEGSCDEPKSSSDYSDRVCDCVVLGAGDRRNASLDAATTTTPSSSDATAVARAPAASDSLPPSGAQPLGLGMGGRKELNISLNASQSWDSSPPVAVQSLNSWEPAISFGGALRLNFDVAKAQTFLSYNGNGIAYPNGNPVFTTYQNFGFSQNVKMGRWTLTAADTLNYSPDSTFGGYGNTLTPAGTTSINSSVVNPQYVPNQTILTPYASSYFNTVLGQIEYGLSRRSSWTATGSYGLLRYPDSSLNNTNQLVASTGYNRSLTARDSIFATYSYSEFQFTTYSTSFTSQNVQIGYSRTVSGRLSFQASGGPEFTNATSIGAAQKQVQFAGAAN